MAEVQVVFGQVLAMIGRGLIADPEYVNNVALGKLELPGGRAKNCPIKVTYSYDLNQ